MLSIVTRAAASSFAFLPKTREIGSRARALIIGSLRRTISIAGFFRHVIMAWLPAVIYSAPNHDSGICGVCERAYSYSEWRVFLLLRTFRPRVSSTVLAGASFPQNTGSRNYGSYATVDARGLFARIAQHGCETRIVVALINTLPFVFRDPVRCSQRVDPSYWA